MGSKVIGFCGAARSGKDTAASFLVDSGWERVSFADPVRAGVEAMNPWIRIDMSPREMETAFGESAAMRLAGLGKLRFRLLCIWNSLSPIYRTWNHITSAVGYELAKSIPEYRHALQLYGTEAGREIHGTDCWIDIAQSRIKDCWSRGASVVVPDVRFENEANLIRGLGGKVVLVDNPNAPRVSHKSHASELGVEPDVTIVNDSTLYSLRKKVEKHAK